MYMKKSSLTLRTSVFLTLSLTLFLMTGCSSSSNDDNLPKNEVNNLERIEIKQLPNQTVYALHEAINLTGLQVMGYYNDDSKKPININTKNISGFDSSKPAKQQTVTITYAKQTATFLVDILDVEVKDGVLLKFKVEGPEVVIPQGVTEIAKGVFYNNQQIKKVVLPEGLKKIANEAFIFSSVEEINFPSSLVTIEQDAFNQCRKLKRIDLSKTKLTEIPASAFYAAQSATDVLLPETLTTIGSQAFVQTEALSKLTIPSKVTSIGIEAFRQSGITELLWPNGVSEVKERAFYICPNLERVKTYGPTPTNPSDEARLGHSAFEQAMKLVEFNLPTGITYIGQRVIGGNTALKEFTVHENIKYIHFSAFGYRGGLERVIVKPTTPPLAIDADTAWYGFPDDVKVIEVPAQSVEQYKVAKGWKEFSTKIVAAQ